MKKFILSTMLLSFTINSFSQVEKAPKLSKEYYLQKSKNKKTAAWILLGGGTAMMVGGLIAFGNNWDNSDSYTATDISGFFAIGGFFADIVSIPFFVSAHKNKIRAARVAITGQKILWYQKNSIGFETQPCVTIKIGLGNLVKQHIIKRFL